MNRAADTFPQRVVALVPARDEAAAVGGVVAGLLALERAPGVPLLARVVVCDNGSRDATATVAAAAGASVVHQAIPGYGAACLAAATAMDNAAGDADTLLYVDADASVQLAELPALVAALAQADLVVGSRAHGSNHAGNNERCINESCFNERRFNEPGALTWPQRVGNALASALIRALWRQPVTDLGPTRVIRRSVYDALGMADTRYGWTVEMQVKAIARGFRVVEVPVSARRRIGRSKISGTLRGVTGAAFGIFGMIARLWWAERRHAATRLPAAAHPVGSARSE
jgi:glycosyltransferase involved in cell wall biosynthesis